VKLAIAAVEGGSREKRPEGAVEEAAAEEAPRVERRRSKTRGK